MGTKVRLIPWVAVAALAVGLVVVASRPGAARVIGAIVGAAGAIGVVEHVWANYVAGPLDYRYATRWSAMSSMSRWWAAANGSVGPSPVLAPAILTLAALMLVFACGGSVRRHG